MRYSILLNAVLVHGLIFGGFAGCKGRQDSQVKGDEKADDSKLYEDHIQKALAEQDPEKVKAYKGRISRMTESFMGLDRSQTIQKLLELTQKIYLDTDIEQDWNAIPAEKRTALLPALEEFASLRVAISKKAETDSDFRTIVRDVYNATVGHLETVKIVDGKKQTVRNVNYGKIPFERFDDARLYVYAGSKGIAISAIVFLLVIVGSGAHQELGGGEAVLTLVQIIAIAGVVAFISNEKSDTRSDYRDSSSSSSSGPVRGGYGD